MRFQREKSTVFLAWAMHAPIALAFCGCSPSAPPPPATFAVTGRVTMRGEPLQGGIIQFISERDPALNMSAMIQGDGAFELTTLHANQNLSGAVEGPCDVLVTLPIVAGQIPQTIHLPEKLHVGPQANHFEVELAPS